MSELRRKSTLEDVVRTGVRSGLVETHTALPGVVEAFDAATQRASIRIPIKRVSLSIEGTKGVYDFPLLTEVPVWMPNAGGFSISLPVAVGDEALLVILERDCSRWLRDSLEQTPETFRLHNPSDAVALVGLNTQASKITPYNATDLEISGPASSIILRANGDVEVSGTKVSITAGVGSDEVLSMLEELATLVTSLTVNDPVSGPQGVTVAASAAWTALAVRFAAMKV
jgi:hypothetical protein